MKLRGFPIVAVVCALALAPAAAIAASGDDQYCDPFGGCGGPTTPTTQPTKPHGHSGGGQSHGVQQGGRQGSQGGSSAAAGLVIAIQQQSPAQIEQKIRENSSNPFAAAVYEQALQALKSKRANDVLDAAGLSALKALLSHS